MLDYRKAPRIAYPLCILQLRASRPACRLPRRSISLYRRLFPLAGRQVRRSKLSENPVRGHTTDRSMGSENGVQLRSGEDRTHPHHQEEKRTMPRPDHHERHNYHTVNNR
jgi:hypothetical protein